MGPGRKLLVASVLLSVVPTAAGAGEAKEAVAYAAADSVVFGSVSVSDARGWTLGRLYIYAALGGGITTDQGASLDRSVVGRWCSTACENVEISFRELAVDINGDITGVGNIDADVEGLGRLQVALRPSGPTAFASRGFCETTSTNWSTRTDYSLITDPETTLGGIWTGLVEGTLGDFVVKTACAFEWAKKSLASYRWRET